MVARNAPQPSQEAKRASCFQGYLVCVEEVAAEFQLSKTRAREILREGEVGRAFKRGRRWFVLRAEFERALKRMAADGS